MEQQWIVFQNAGAGDASLAKCADNAHFLYRNLNVSIKPRAFFQFGSTTVEMTKLSAAEIVEQVLRA